MGVGDWGKYKHHCKRAATSGDHCTQSIAQRNFGVFAVNLSNNQQVNDSSLANLRALSGLSEVYLIRADVGDTGLQFLRELNALVVLHLTGNQKVTDTGLASIGQMARLRSLNISGTGVSDAGLVHLTLLEELAILALTNTEIGDAGLNTLTQLPSLVALRIDGRQLTQAGAESLMKMPKLEVLAVVGPEVGTGEVELIKGLRNLKELYLEGMKPTEARIAGLRAALPDCKIETADGAWGARTDALAKELREGPYEETPPLAVAPFTPEEAKQHQQAWADHLGVPVEFENSIGMKMVLIPPGEFMMGSSEEEIEAVLRDVEEAGVSGEEVNKTFVGEGPQHRVRITRPFYLAKYEVTVGQFKTFAEATDYRTDAEANGYAGSGAIEVNGEWKTEHGPQFNWGNVGFEQSDQHPVGNLNWLDAMAFCEWVSKKEGSTYHLPTEAEWEYACRSGGTARFFFGDSNADLEQYAWYLCKYTMPVGNKLPNHFNLFDMHGNVREWCSDWYSVDYYKASPEKDPVGPSSGVERVLRGEWSSCQPKHFRSGNRGRKHPTFCNLFTGFRPALLIDTNTPPWATPKPPTEDPQPKPDGSSTSSSAENGD